MLIAVAAGSVKKGGQSPFPLGIGLATTDFSVTDFPNTLGYGEGQWVAFLTESGGQLYRRCSSEHHYPRKGSLMVWFKRGVVQHEDPFVAR